MKVDIEDGRLIVTPITEEDARIIYALAAAYAAFDAVCYPIMGEAVRCTEGDSAQSSDATTSSIRRVTCVQTAIFSNPSLEASFHL